MKNRIYDFDCTACEAYRELAHTEYCADHQEAVKLIQEIERKRAAEELRRDMIGDDGRQDDSYLT